MSEGISSIGNIPSPHSDDEEKQTGLDFYQNISQNLNSPRLTDHLIGLKTLLAMISKGENVSSFFPLVVQEITSEDETLRHLSYVFLVHYAESDPDSALMSINTFQRNLSDSDPIVRALSLKVLSSIRSEEIIEIVMEAIQQCITDVSPYVRKAASLAIIKVYETDVKSIEYIKQFLVNLLKDQSTIAISGALYAFQCICPDNDKIIHPIFRSLCRMLPKLDPWGQSIALHILQRYARRNFVAPLGNDDWFSAEEDEPCETDSDLDLLIKMVQQLLNSIIPSVTIAAASLMFYCAPEYKLPLIVKPLTRLLYLDQSTSYLALTAISSFVIDNSEIFIPQIRHFFIFYDDNALIKKLKLRLISLLARPSNSDIIIKELIFYVHENDKEIASEAIRAIGRTASLAGDATISCVNTLAKLLSSPIQAIVSQAIQMMCLLLRPYPKKESLKSTEIDNNFLPADCEILDSAEVTSQLKMILSVFSRIDDATTKAAVISLIGDKAALIPLQAHEVLRQLAMTYTQQPDEVKLQAVSLAAKLIAIRPSEVSELTRYIFTLGFYDKNNDIRDRSRLLHSLLTAPTEIQYFNALRQKTKDFLFPQKQQVVWNGDIIAASSIEVGSFSSIFGTVLSKNSLVVPWEDKSKIPNASVRDERTSNSTNDFSEIIVSDIKDDDDDDLDTFFEPVIKKNKLSPTKTSKFEEEEGFYETILG